MYELIKIEEKEGKQTCNARDLWKFMESNGEIIINIKTLVYQKGINYIRNIIKGN